MDESFIGLFSESTGIPNREEKEIIQSYRRLFVRNHKFLLVPFYRFIDKPQPVFFSTNGGIPGGQGGGLNWFLLPIYRGTSLFPDSYETGISQKAQLFYYFRSRALVTAASAVPFRPCLAVIADALSSNPDRPTAEVRGRRRLPFYTLPSVPHPRRPDTNTCIKSSSLNNNIS